MNEEMKDLKARLEANLSAEKEALATLEGLKAERSPMLKDLLSKLGGKKKFVLTGVQRTICIRGETYFLKGGGDQGIVNLDE